MKVIKPGRVSVKQEFQVECTGRGNSTVGCGAILEVSYSDLRYYQGVPGDSWGSRDPAVCFKCPCCFAISDLPKSLWPAHPADLKPWTRAWYINREQTLDTEFR